MKSATSPTGRRPRVTSGLSPYLHFGHVSPHQVFVEMAEREGWTPERISGGTSGKRRGWWGMSGVGEAFLDQLVTWCELGDNLTSRSDDYDRYQSLPAWARETLAEHRGDERHHLYGLDELEGAATHSEIWNAAQRQLAAEGTIHNYMRMVWGKKILHWSATPEDAQQVRPRRPQPELLQRHQLVLRALRPPVGTRAPGLRHGALHEPGEHEAQAAPRRLPRALRRPGAARPGVRQGGRE